MSTPELAIGSQQGSLLPEIYRVEEVIPETHDTFTLALIPQEGEPMTFAPGQFNMLYAYGAGESAISISGDPDLDGASILHTIRTAGTVTSALRGLRPGDSLGVRGPFGTSWPMEAARGKDVIFIGGGIGLAPLRPAIYRTLNRLERYGRVRVLIGARRPRDLLFMNEIAGWPVETLVSVDRATERWRGHVGVVTPYVRNLEIDPGNTVAMICGPEIMMRYAVMELLNHGMRPKDIFITMERNMKCAVGFCGHCQLGSEFICKDGPVFSYETMQFWFAQREF
ncbi:MAG: FAD/NAD(P)-binding protein [Gemmatimonadetes bacterium]|nr:FAD/NAD(P)-binding protein [Gemmatimonadota bacterium]